MINLNSNKIICLKSISWRVVATTTTLSVSYILTKKIDKSISIALIDSSLKFLFYFLHDKAWIKCNNEKNDKENDTQTDIENNTETDTENQP